MIWDARGVARVMHVATRDPSSECYTLDADLNDRLGGNVRTMNHVRDSDYVAELVPLPADATGVLGSPVDVLMTDSDSGSEVEFGGARAPGFD